MLYFQSISLIFEKFFSVISFLLYLSYYGQIGGHVEHTSSHSLTCIITLTLKTEIGECSDQKGKGNIHNSREGV